jgi:hypothetical protein
MDSSAKTLLEPIQDDRTGLSVPVLRRACADNLFYVQGKFPAIATKNEGTDVDSQHGPDGKISSDRAIREYNKAVWHVKPVKVELDKYIHGDAGLKVETLEAVLS